MIDHPQRFSRSFILDLYDREHKFCKRTLLPLQYIAPHGNRIFRELIPHKLRMTREPWYWIIPHHAKDQTVERSPYPEGPTSLYGQRYFPEKEPEPRLELYPKTYIRNFTFAIDDLRTILFQGKYTVDDIFLAGAEYIARKWIEKGEIKMADAPFFYEVNISPAEVRTIHEDMFPPEAYQVEGVFRLPQLSRQRKRTRFRKIIPKPFPICELSKYGPTQTSGRGKPGNGRILMHARVHRALTEEIELSDKVEVGGFLVGRPFRQPDSAPNEDDPDFRWSIEITDLVKAEGAWGKPLALLFTGDTWSLIRKRIDIDFADKELVIPFAKIKLPSNF